MAKLQLLIQCGGSAKEEEQRVGVGVRSNPVQCDANPGHLLFPPKELAKFHFVSKCPGITSALYRISLFFQPPSSHLEKFHLFRYFSALFD